MSHRWLLSLLCFVVLFLSLVQLTRAGGELRVDETGSSILLDKKPAEVLLAVENPSATTLNANIQLELLDPQNNTIVKTNQLQPIARGSQKLRLPLPLAFSTSNEKERNEILWYRLHYRLTLQESPAETLADGIVSLSEMASDLFELKVSAPQLVKEGSRYRVRVEAAHPATHRPAENVRINAQVTLDADDDNMMKLSGSKLTDDKGQAFLDFELPRRFPKFPHRSRHNGGELQVSGVKGGMVVQTKGDFLVSQFARVLITTDKPLYQPGQVMHMRALLFTPSMTALPNHEVYFKISDPERATLYRAVATSSRFGVASADWTIPENTKLGDYRIWVGIDGGDDQEGHDVRISRYELPNFRVNVEQDRKFYLPGQNATVTVRAEYLFGQPILRGNVRVVRESNRYWDYREQKWKLDEEPGQKGETNADGSFVANLDLSSLHKDLKDSDYRRFEDITFAAYFTDPTTNRTEQRRFDVRVTMDPIHVYVLEDFDSRYNRDLPLNFYVSTFYADGSPARCKVEVKFTDDVEDSDSTKRVATVTTSRYGLARVSARLPKDLEEITTLDVVVSASDSRGQKGSNTEEFRVSDEPSLHVETAKAIYAPGESVTAVITSSGLDETVIVDLAAEASVIRSERVRLRDGRAWVVFPFRPEFKGRLSIVAYSDSGESAKTVAIRSVLYPHNAELNVDVRSSRDTFRPGEEAKLNLSVRSPEGRSKESALGVVVLDQAVIERFRTDQEFGGSAYGFDNVQRFLGFEDRVAGVSLRDIQRIDTSKPISPDMDLLAAMLLKNTTNHYPSFYSSDDFDEADAAELFGKSIKEQLNPLKKALSDTYENTMEYPSNGEELRNSLSRSKIDFNNVRDPWGMPYRASFSVNKESDALILMSNGADKQSGTEDDFVVEQMSWPYFRSRGETIDQAIMRYHQRTGKFIRDAATLRDEIATHGVKLDQLRDRWGEPYRLDFEIKESDFVLKIRSGGPDKRFSKNELYPWDDFMVWQSKIDYFAGPRAQISAALTENLDRTKTFPLTDQQLDQSLRGLSDGFNSLRDPWDHSYYATFRTESIYTGRVNVANRSTLGEGTSRMVVTPVNQTVAFVGLRSMGPDAKAGTSDDFSVATFKGVISEQPRDASAPFVFTSGVVLTTSNGAVVGIVTDPIGAVISGVTVKATRSPGNHTYETTTNENGRYSFANLPPGLYEFTFDATGFSRSVMSSVLVRAHNIVEVNTRMEVGHIAQTVQITAESSPLQTVESSVSITSSKKALIDLRKIVTRSGSQELSTPRLREYFPETLLWQPSIETGKDGRAEINLKLADNITTWKMLVVGSTEDGRIGTAEKEIKAFQPFFVEHEPPRVLTEGDEISLPVVVRNYLSRPQKVDLEIKPESWFSLLGPAQKQTSVLAGDAMRETFDFRVVAPVKDGKQRITARGSDENDAIEKPVSVHPDGAELSVTSGDVLDDETSLEFEIASTMISNSNRGELKIYPNLLTHVAEGVEAIMERPYGCGEQTISSTYPSLLLLRHYKNTGEGFPLRTKAQRYLNDGYSRLLNYRVESGGFTYWGSGDADLTLTAYALQFLVDASKLTSVDQNVVRNAREWLVKQQQEDGSWGAQGSTDKEDNGRALILTAYVARVLSRTDAEASEPLKRALDFLRRASQQIDEPYFLALYALAATEAKDAARAKPAIEKLRTLAHEEGNTSYWSLKTYTPFYGLGRAGVVETTSLVVQALATQCNSQTAGCDADRRLINRGLLFLLKEKDRYGVWYSTQTTINVLDAMLLLFSNSSLNNVAQQSVDIVVNGNPVQAPQITDRFNNPVAVDISRFLNAGKNRIQIKRPQGLPVASVQTVASYYVPWSEAKTSSKSDLRLHVKYDKTEAKINDEITCSVKVERVNTHGDGMMLAEIGIPPGAEVDRSTLQTAKEDWAISQYDVLPDRVLVYLWPRANGVSFNFKFRPRFGLRAKSAASILYDYYNPDSVVVLPPSLFTVR